MKIIFLEETYSCTFVFSCSGRNEMFDMLQQQDFKEKKNPVFTALQLKLYYLWVCPFSLDCISFKAQMGRFSKLCAHTYPYLITSARRVCSWIHPLRAQADPVSVGITYTHMHALTHTVGGGTPIR